MGAWFNGKIVVSKTTDGGSIPSAPAYSHFMSKKNKGNSIFYKKTSVNDFILFAIYSVLLNKEICTFERLIKECFTLFPKTFGFSNYPQWPDARKLDRPLRFLRNRKLIGGDPASFFYLTKKGKEISESLAKALKQGRLL